MHFGVLKDDPLLMFGGEKCRAFGLVQNALSKLLLGSGTWFDYFWATWGMADPFLAGRSGRNVLHPPGTLLKKIGQKWPFFGQLDQKPPFHPKTLSDQNFWKNVLIGSQAFQRAGFHGTNRLFRFWMNAWKSEIFEIFSQKISFWLEFSLEWDFLRKISKISDFHPEWK